MLPHLNDVQMMWMTVTDVNTLVGYHIRCEVVLLSLTCQAHQAVPVWEEREADAP